MRILASCFNVVKELQRSIIRRRRRKEKLNYLIYKLTYLIYNKLQMKIIEHGSKFTINPKMNYFDF